MNKTKLILLMIAILLCSGMSIDVYSPSVPTMKIYFNTSIQKMTFTFVVYYISMAISGLLASIFSDHYGRKLTLLIANSFFMCSTILLIFSYNINIFILLRIIQGLSAGFNFIITRQIIKDSFLIEKEQTNIFSLLYIAFIISSAISPLIGAYTALYFWWLCFLVIFMMQVVIFIMIIKTLKETIIVKKNIPNPIKFIGSYILFCFTGNFNAVAIIAGLLWGSFVGFTSVASFIFISDLKISPINFAWMFSFLAIPQLISNYLLRFLNNHDFSKNRIISYGCIFTTIGIIILPIYFLNLGKLFSIIILLVSAIFMRFGLGLTLTVAQIYVMNIFTKNSGQALGALNFYQISIGGVLVMLITRFINLVLGIFVVGIFSMLMIFIIYKLFLKNVYFSHFKYKFIKKMLHDKRMRKFIM